MPKPLKPREIRRPVLHVGQRVRWKFFHPHPILRVERLPDAEDKVLCVNIDPDWEGLGPTVETYSTDLIPEDDP
jgi:hypothetical protein